MVIIVWVDGRVLDQTNIASATMCHSEHMTCTCQSSQKGLYWVSEVSVNTNECFILVLYHRECLEGTVEGI